MTLRPRPFRITNVFVGLVAHEGKAMDDTKQLRPAVFLDRDGTLIEDRGHLADPGEVVFLPGTINALRRLRDDFLFFIVTNQPGVAEGTISIRDVERINAHVVSRLAEAGLTISAGYVCPHRRVDGCACIKPNPHFLHKAAEDFGISLRHSFVVGDHPHDVELAERAGAQGVYVCTGHGLKHLDELRGNQVVVPDIRAAAEWILSRWPPHRMRHNVGDAAEIIRRGGVVVFPTETVYGLGANAFDRLAVARVFEIKNRPRLDPLIVHVADRRHARCLVKDFPAEAWRLAERFWPGPLTLVLPKIDELPDIVTAGLRSVAIRVPCHAVALALLWETGVAVAAPSANLFGRISPTTAEHAAAQLGTEVDMILDGGPCSIGVESTVVSFCGPNPLLLRPGGLPIEEIEAVVGPLENPSPEEPVPLSPGRLPRHYAPRTPVVLCSDPSSLPSGSRLGLLCLEKPSEADDFAAVEVLSEQGDLHEAAASLFAAMHRLDGLDLDFIVARPLPRRGIGQAVMDRLTRASSQRPAELAIAARKGACDGP
jgi:L-threonylcarbamoyladenylate synthase